MRYFLFLIVISSIISCRSKVDKPEEEPVRIITIKPSAHTDSIRKVISDIETKNLQLAGITILSLKIDGMEAIRISLKDYYKDAVIKYLDKLINKTTADDLVYKVVYYLNATTTSTNFNQLKTTYLDQHFNKKTMDYSFLNSSNGVANE